MKRAGVGARGLALAPVAQWRGLALAWRGLAWRGVGWVRGLVPVVPVKRVVSAAKKFCLMFSEAARRHRRNWGLELQVKVRIK